ncbi:MAG: HD domain-containing phosphohydrolase [Anaerolineales bacterium]|nr:HD domain-containing phosphohydrolase [Anaerolineales bacterium]
MKRSLANLQALQAIDRAITSSLDIRLTLDVLLEQAISRLSADAARVMLLNPYTYRLEFAAGQGFRSQSHQHSRFLLGEGLAGRAALEHKILDSNEALLEGEDVLRTSQFAEEGFVCYRVAPLAAKGQVLGVLELFFRAHHEPDQEWVNFFATLAGQAAIAIDNARLFEHLQNSNFELSMAYDSTIEGWSRALDLRDSETEGHTQRVTELTVKLAQAMGISDQDIVHIRRGALLHDIGKMGVPDSILLKPGKLTDEEWAIMRQHPTFAYELLRPIKFLNHALEIPYCHHEKWDGTGYPRGLEGEQIPLSARIFAVADVWDALTSDRPYRKAWSDKEALEYIRQQTGHHFDPQVVALFLRTFVNNAGDQSTTHHQR